MSRPRHPAVLGLPALLLAAVLALSFLLAATPPRHDWKLRKVRIPKGSGYPEIERILESAGLLRSRAAFRLLVTVTGSSKRLQQGEYAFPSPPSAVDLWRKLSSGDVNRYSVTIPGGSTLYDIARILEEQELLPAETFLAEATSPGLVGRIGIPAQTAEGFLFPETYTLVKDMTGEEILRYMHREFRKFYDREIAPEASRQGLSTLDVVTIASIIEKETGIPGEKPLVSAVIRRRLDRGMPLQMDPTVIYGLRKFGGNLTRADLRAENPYNTYRLRGLPPGPIASPDRDSLRAAVAPAREEYLYFVSRNDGTHEFSRTLTEHNAAVQTYQKARTGKGSAAAGAVASKPEKGTGGPPTPPPPRPGPS